MENHWHSMKKLAIRCRPQCRAVEVCLVAVLLACFDRLHGDPSQIFKMSCLLHVHRFAGDSLARLEQVVYATSLEP